MLKTFLSNLKRQSVLSQTEAVATVENILGSDWDVSDSGLERTFEFGTYEDANNFLVRYNEYCEKVNAEPSWSNVYNKVTVSLKCPDQQAITRKEVTIAKYLNMVHDVAAEMDDILSENFAERDYILLGMERAKNDQGVRTEIGGQKEYLKLV